MVLNQLRNVLNNISFFNLLLIWKMFIYILQDLNFKDYIYLWRSKINKRSYIVKWFNNNSKNSNLTELDGYLNYKHILFKKKKLNNYFWLIFFNNKLLFNTNIFKINLLSGLPKIWKIKYNV